MAKRKTRRRYEVPGNCRFLTFSCYRQLPLFNNDAIKDAFVEQLDRARSATQFQLFGYVVMPEHVHLLLRPNLPDSTVTQILRQLKGPFSHRLLQRWVELEAAVIMRVTDA